MNIHPALLVRCDSCRVEYLEVYDELRRDLVLAGHGWAESLDGKDICPKCQKLQRENKPYGRNVE